jgi:tetratricopeptide (TPR) repeat protein
VGPPEGQLTVDPTNAEPENSWFAAAALRRIFGIAVPDLAVALGLILTVFAIYLQAAQFGFIRMDDDLYVARNPAVQAGLTPASIKWAFTAVVASNWMPVTILSHMLDVELFGVNSGMHHLVNVLFHVLASVVLFGVLLRATRARGASAFAAFIFALHPLHVESVAWISERKDVLSTLFFFLALYGYVRYTERPSVGRYLSVAGLFFLGLLAKPMLVTFPFVLLLFDSWPLARLKWPRVLWEKVPLFALSAAVSVVAYRVQWSAGSVEASPLDGRIAKAFLSYITYIRQTLWPVHLSAFYPYPRIILASRVVLAILILLGVSAVALRRWRQYPYLATGWFWYLGTLVPVIGLVKIGQQSHADRYMYIPMVGLSIMVAWGARDIAAKWPRTRGLIAGAGVLCCCACLVLSAEQASYWLNGETLYGHAIQVTDDNWLAHANLGLDLMNTPGRGGEAVEHLEAALRIRPGYAEAENNLGLYLLRIDLCSAAVPHFENAIRIRPDMVEAHNNLANCLTAQGNYLGSIGILTNVVRYRPAYANAHFSLAIALSKLGGHDAQAIAEYETGLRFDPGSVVAQRGVAALLAAAGKTQEAISHYEAAQRIQPDPEVAKVLDGLLIGSKK